MTATPQTPQPPQMPPEAQQLLDKMHGIIAPEPVNWWPPAPGWWMLAVLIIAGLLVLILRVYRRRKSTAYKRSALHLVNDLKQYPDDQLPTEANRLLKRVALVAFPGERTTINQLYGETWVSWLNQRCKNPVFSGATATALAHGGYQSGVACPGDQLMADIQRWIHAHRPPTRTKQGGAAHV